MSRFYDRVMVGCELPKGYRMEMPSELLERAVVLDATNVARYFLGYPPESREKMLVSIPNLAPTVETMFIEATFPDGFAMEGFKGESYESLSRFYSWGVLIHAMDMGSDSGREPEAVRAEMEAAGMDSEDALLVGRVRWIERAWVFAEPSKKHPMGPLFYYTMAIGYDGQVLANKNGKALSDFEIPSSDGGASEEERANIPAHELSRRIESLKKARDLSCAALDVLDSLLMAVAFTHCKNVVVSPVEPPEKPSKKHERKFGRPLVRYNILEIEPMKHVLSTEGRSETDGLKRALHITRGHFRRYSDEKPLFGKYVGNFWVSQHTRGSMQAGIVEKDYSVKPPSTAGKIF